ncbi:hypothetical protein ACGFZA_32145 [Streptomyces sp. NPDC048211]|uniref:hypothetical protein n=1 Tax=Streptomyces sp. NPDC048211 TaxID=3365516 RepID=UPI00371EF79F
MGETSDLEALAAALDAYEPASADWTHELGELYERVEAERHLLRVEPPHWTDELWERYRRTQVPAPHVPLTRAQQHLFARERDRERRASRAQHLLEALRVRLEEAGLREPARAAGLAERGVRANLAAATGVFLLYKLGAPHGEAALLRLVADDTVDRADRQEARSWLIILRRPRNRALGRQPQESETPLLPSAVRGLPDAWGLDAPWPPRVTMDRGNAAAVHAALEALLPARRAAVPEPPPEMTGTGDEEPEERPDWVDVRILLGQLMPYPRTVTRERMAEVRREAGRMGLESGGDFAERWTTRIGAWLAGAMFAWLCEATREPAAHAPWAADLAERYVLRGYAAEHAERFLDLSADLDPCSPAAPGRLRKWPAARGEAGAAPRPSRAPEGP